MLCQLLINDLAIIDTLDLKFDSGMTVLTGETGAGKSILLDALGLILGDRAETGIIRNGREKTDINAVFSIADNTELRRRLDEMGIEVEDELFIRRIISRDGRSRAFLNNIPTPVQGLRNIGECLVDIHGQHAHQSLLRSVTRRELLDHAGSHDALLNEVTAIHREWKHIRVKLENIRTNDVDAGLALLRYQIEELDEMNIGASEYTDIATQYKRLSNSEKVLDICWKIVIGLSESDNAIDTQLGTWKREVREFCEIDNKLDNIATLLDGALIQIEEAAGELRSYIDQFDMDNERLARLESRLDKFSEFSRKYKVKPEQLYEHLETLRARLRRFEDDQEKVKQLRGREVELREHYFVLAGQLHAKRQETAADISAKITAKIRELGINGQFSIDVKTIDDTDPHPHGMDKISFLVSTNPGQPLQTLNKVASGGELSRLSLAIQIIGSKDSGVPTLIFDEVDTGISGGVAEIVGKTLYSLAEYRQIFSVTHLAPVASFGHHHFLVSKEDKNNETFTRVVKLAGQDRVSEIARMLAGVKITDESRANAQQMLESV